MNKVVIDVLTAVICIALFLVYISFGPGVPVLSQ